MVDLENINTLTEYIVPLWFNEETKSVTIELKCATSKAIQQKERDALSLSPEKTAEMNHEFLKKHVGKIKNFSVDGQQIENIDDLWDRGPSDFYSWVFVAVYDAQTLSGLERKN